ncbi:hypothetical protein BKA70DRAFT_1226952 [Coprinopsis sp. MPI-PUGE-AT-0042]|nr:hypothetical protein BKA70DRAFT_1226952 [Coprinopsis sp. MPI-PUGE-AT-0042]
MSDTTPFYAYIHYNDLRRITPQYFTHDVAKFNCVQLLVDARIKSISGHLSRTLVPSTRERSWWARALASSGPPNHLRPCQWKLVLHSIQVEPHILLDDPSDSDSQRAIVGSYKRRTRFRVTIHASCSGVAPKADAIMIVRPTPTSDPVSGNLSGLVETNTLYTFRFGDLLEGKSVNAVSISSDEAVLSFFTGPDSNPGEFWELA